MKSFFLPIVFLGIFLLFAYTFLMGDITYLNRPGLLRETFLKNILEMDVRNNSIFFLETSFRVFEHGVIEINKRAACALESAALHHPNHSIYMLYIFPNTTEEVAVADKFLKPLLSYPNINVVFAILSDYIKNTPVESLYMKNIIDTSPFWINHHSDILRLITLMKYGGIYMDSDVIVLKSVDELGDNFIALETAGILCNAVIGFRKQGFGHEFLETLLKDVNENYNPMEWGAHGPILFTKWAQKLCNTTELEQFSNKQCSSLRILSPDYFYPIYATFWNKLFNEKDNDEVFKSAENSYVVHYWNKMSSAATLSVDSSASYIILARKNCPKVYRQLYKTL